MAIQAPGAVLLIAFFAYRWQLFFVLKFLPAIIQYKPDSAEVVFYLRMFRVKIQGWLHF